MGFAFPKAAGDHPVLSGHVRDLCLRPAEFQCQVAL